MQEDDRGLPGRRSYRARRWALRAFSVALAAAVVVALALAWRASHQPSFVALPAPVLGDASVVAALPAPLPTVPAMPTASTLSTVSTVSTVPTPTVTTTPTTATPTTATPTTATPTTATPTTATPTTATPTTATPTTATPTAATPTAATAPAASSFAPSQALQIYVPNANPDLVISTSVQPLGGCRSIIDPPRSGPGWAGVFGCSDFGQPGTSSPSLAVLAGHSSRAWDTVFNKLYRQGTALENQMVYLRTQDSGSHWLSYRVLHTYVPDKGELPYMTAVWGGDGCSTSGRLVLVTCQQTDTSTESTANYVAVAQFVGVM